MKKVSLVLAVLALVSCKFNQNGNKGLLPMDDSRTAQTASPQVDVADKAIVEKDSDADLLDASGNYIYNVGDMLEITLPDGSTMEIGKNSTENQLFEMLENADFTVATDKTQGWITLDRVYFNTGSDQLTTASKAQLDNIDALLKAFPGTEVKLGGYTDNTGSQDINKPLSEGRAKSVMNALSTSGIDVARMAAEGYGSDHPVCPDSNSEVCKAQNRRVDIHITKK